jgi:transcriptional regulator with XRE-family HTH domain
LEDSFKNSKNDLKRARKRAGLDLKQAAFLLSKEHVSDLIRYEKGLVKPGLATALKFEIVYQRPIRVLFQDLYEHNKREVTQLKESHLGLFPNNYWFPEHFEQLEQEEHCFYSQMLKTGNPTRGEIELIIKHIIALSKIVSDYKQDRKPYS